MIFIRFERKEKRAQKKTRVTMQKLLTALLAFCIVSPNYGLSFSLLTLQNEEDRLDKAAEKGWGEWGEWRPCSRSCGGGVTFMQRQCLTTRNNGIPDCVGPNRKYSSCNIQDCPDGSIDFRAEQCSAFNNQSYGGRTHQWTPYVGASALNPCELHCQPEDRSFFIKQAEKVIDGTRCRPNLFHVCVDGTCQRVGCDMILGSSLKLDKCMECGGNGSSCYRVHGIFSAPNPPSGYTDIIVIPVGATNIQIDELRASRNYFAIRNSAGEYVLNGDWKINRSRSLQVAGTMVNYHRKLDRKRAPESLRASGPTTDIIYVDLVVQEKNRGIRYSFYLPQGTNDPNRGNIEWNVGKWSKCTRDCGGGTQSRRLTCYKDGNKVSSYLCKSIQRPQRRQQCKLGPCLARWHVSNWTDCTETCNGGIRFRQVYCTETPRLSNSPPRLVQDSRCIAEDGTERPSSRERCNEKSCFDWIVGNWTECSSTCGVGRQERQVVCHTGSFCASSSAPARIRECNLGPCTGIEWVVTPWSLCTEKCGKGMQTRLVHCASEGVKYDDELCKNLHRPSSHRMCHSTSECTDDLGWMTGDWSECSAQCGKGMQTRKVVCSVVGESTYRTFPDAHCVDSGDKPAFMRNCTQPDCGATWFTGPWKLCSLSCGGGRQTRHVMCLSETTYHVLKQSDCDMERKPIQEQVCNAEACPTQNVEDNDENNQASKDSLYIECVFTQYGCCPDNRTPAQGWLMEGCIDVNPTSNCLSSRYGCCKDGVQPAVGHNHLGCPEYYTCHVASESGRRCGQKWLPRWYYDAKASRCRHFWYGGCDGNRNNYISEKVCLQECDSSTASNISDRRYSGDSVISHSSSATASTTTLDVSTPPIGSSIVPDTRHRSPISMLRTPAPTTTVLFVPFTSLAPSRDEFVQTTRTARFFTVDPTEGTHAPRQEKRLKVLTIGEYKVLTRTNRRRAETKCEFEKVRADFVGGRSPQCNVRDGRYRKLQCVTDDVGETSSCWCVDPDSGIEIEGSRRNGAIAPDCDSVPKPLKDCANSKYGCCVDGVTSARDHARTGCREPARIRLDRTVVSVKRGGAARLSCPASGSPKPVIQWFKDGKGFPSRHFKSSARVDKVRHALIFVSASPRDAGRYVCEANNGVGQPQRKTVQLVLQEEHVRFRITPSNISVDEGQHAVLKCRIRGNRGAISWLKDGNPERRGKRVMIHPWGDLRISRAVFSDSGKYTCIATSLKREITAYAYIAVLPRKTTTVAATVPTTTEPAPKTYRNTTSEDCIDNPMLADCRLVVAASMCHKEAYRKICCLSCRLNRRLATNSEGSRSNHGSPILSR